MVNRGVAPLDPDTTVGQFRVRAGDTVYVPLNPTEVGYGNYLKWSDDEILVFLGSNPSMPWAIYEAYLQLATSAALESSSISDYDLKIDNTKRADQLYRIATEWRNRAEEDDNALGEEAFEIVPTGTRSGVFIPEGTMPVWGRSYTWSRWR